MKSKKKHMLNILYYVIFSLCSYLMVYVVYTMLNYVPLLCSLLVLLDYVCIIFSTLLLCPCWILYP